MKDAGQITRAEAIQSGPGQSSLSIQTEVPQARGSWCKKPSIKRRLLTGVAAVFVLYILGAVLGLTPCSYSSSRVAGRNVAVVSYSPSIAMFSTPASTRIETGGQSVTIRGDVVDLGSGRTMTIPDWCKEIRISIRWGRISVTFMDP